MFYRTILRSLAILVMLVAGAQWWMTTGAPVALSLPDDPLEKVEAQVFEAIQSNSATDIVIQFAGQADLSGAEALDWQARGEEVYLRLRETAGRDQSQAIGELERQSVRYYSSFAANRLFVWEVDLELLTWLASLPEVNSIRAPHTYAIFQSIQENASAAHGGALEILAAGGQFTVLQATQPQEMSWGVIDTKADQFWSTFGFQGEGIVVAGIDTGVQYDHPALDQAYKCQDDPGDPACWWDPENECGGVPCDDNGHGTATMGPIVADDDPALPYQVGMAPGGQWIACKGCSSSSCSEFALTSCADWVMAPGGEPANRPHVVSNSWGGACEDGDWYLPYINAWMAAGITASFSPGGSGPGCGTIGSPAAYQQVFAPTAHDEARLISSFASRGPGCKGDFLKPNISAPGVNLDLPVPTDSWANYSGTSFSNSFGAGAMVLLLSCSPDLIGLPYDLMDALQDTADEPPPGDCGAPPGGEGNYTYGSGYINMLEAGANNCDDVSIELVKTVGTDPTACADTDAITVPSGAQVTYCFELVNSGEITLTVHDLIDDQLGVIWAGHELVLPAWSSVFVTSTAQIDETTLNIATWTATDGQGMTLEASDSALVNVLQPSIALTKTVGLDPGTCAESDTLEALAGSQVTYCYEVLNNGPVTLTMHDLDDSQLGVLFSTYPFELVPGAYMQYLTSTVVYTDVANTATWTAYPSDGTPVSDMDTAFVMVHEQPGLVLTKTVGLAQGVCAESDVLEVTSGTQATYCYQVMNKGDVPLVVHDLVDSQLGELLADHRFELPPGASIYITRTALITASVVNTATWTAYTEWGTQVEMADTASVIVATIEVNQIFLPVVNKDD